MNIAIIYREMLDRNGIAERIELVEFDADYNHAPKFARLYNLQLPADQKDRILYKTYNIKVNN